VPAVENGYALTVTIVADKVTVLGLGLLLRNEPYLALTGVAVHDRQQIVETVARQAPDVVLLDPPTHLQTTLECCRELRAAAPQTELVVFVSAVSAGVVERAQEAGALGVVSRSGDSQELVEAVLAAGRREPYVCSLLRQAPADLSARQESVLALIAEGLSTQDIATQLGVSPETVKSHVKVTLRKLDARGRAHAVAIGLRRALID
jgi:DNA-binding NarL/FixJ family response regulator